MPPVRGAAHGSAVDVDVGVARTPAPQHQAVDVARLDHARREGDDLAGVIDGEVSDVGDDRLRRHLIARHHRVRRGLDHHGTDGDRRRRELHVLRDRLSTEYPDARYFGGRVPDEARPQRVRPRRDVVQKVVTLVARERAERGPHDAHLGIRDRRTRLIRHRTFQFPRCLLRGERTDGADERHRQRDAQREQATEGASHTMRHGYILHMRECAWTGERTEERRHGITSIGQSS